MFFESDTVPAPGSHHGPWFVYLEKPLFPPALDGSPVTELLISPPTHHYRHLNDLGLIKGIDKYLYIQFVS